MANGTLINLRDSSYVRTDPLLAMRIGQHLLALPDEPFSVWDPSSGTGSFFYACAHTPWSRKFGTEISAERAEESRREWPKAIIVTAAFESIKMHGMVDLVLTNPPYFQQNGKRASLRFVTDAGEHLREGGVMVAILTARSDWDGYMINHWLKWYDQIRVWKFPDRTSDEQEGAFDDYKQIVIVGVRRATQAIPSSEDRKRLQGYQWRNASEKSQQLEGWRGEVPPPDLPDVPLENPYRVPASRDGARLVVQNATESTLLYALKTSGAHLSPAWQQATSWPESGYLGSPAMPYTGEAHVAAEIMIGGLDGEIVYGPSTGKDAEPHLFTAFVGQEWFKRIVEDEVKQKLYERGCIRVEMQELGDKPILGVLNLRRGTTHYYQGDAVFRFLQPWLHTLAGRIVEKRQPLYRLDPAEWEIAVTSQFGLDKRLPLAEFPGLATPQLHRVFAMGRSLDVHGRTAIQGEPGTGKTRLATATAARQAYRWRYRTTEFRHSVQPAWVSGLRRAWLKNPRTLALLGLEPVYGWRFNVQRQPKKRQRKEAMLEKSPNARVVAYREVSTGRLIAPEDAGPKALPVLIATPLKVVKEYGKEILAAYPQAEVMHLESYRDIEHWFARCARSSAPVIFGILSHSAKQQAYRNRWRPVVHEKTHLQRVPEMNPDAHLKPSLEPVYDERKQRIQGYRIKATGELLTRQVKSSYFYCPTCGGRIDATPGRLQEKEENDTQSALMGAKKGSQKETKESRTEPVGSLTWFVIKQRWCQCLGSRRNQNRRDQGKPPVLAPLWQKDRTEVTNRKLPPCSFAQWSAAWTQVKAQAERMYAGASAGALIECVRRDDVLLVHLVEAAVRDPQRLRDVAHVVERVDPALQSLRTQATWATTRLAGLLLEATQRDEGWMQEESSLELLLVALARRDLATLMQMVPSVRDNTSEVQHLIYAINEAEQQIAEHVVQAARRDFSNLILSRLVEVTRAEVDWQAIFFHLAYEQSHVQSQLAATKAKRKSPVPGRSQARTRLTVVAEGPIVHEECDRTATRGYESICDERSGNVVAYQMGKGGHMLTPIVSPHSGRVVGYRDATNGKGKEVMKKTCYDYRTPAPDGFSPYDYLYRFFPGCVALTVVDESHNGRTKDSDISQAFRQAMRASQMRMLTSGTHYGGNIIDFYHYWFSYHPSFWIRLGFGWNDAEFALRHYGVVQQWTKEYESEARKGSGQTNTTVSTVPAPGLSAKLIPGLLEDLTYLTVLDVGAHMPPKKEIPKGISMHDPILEEKVKKAQQECIQASKDLVTVQQDFREAKKLLESTEQQIRLASLQRQLLLAEDALARAQCRLSEVRAWVSERDLAGVYGGIVKELEVMAREGNAAARLAQGTIPRWFAALPCDTSYEVYATKRDDWGDKGEPELVIRTPVLAWDYLYPMERLLIETVQAELAEKRTVMIYIEQITRSMSKRLQWVLGQAEIACWVLPHNTEAEDRQQAILDALNRDKHEVVIVPYRLVNEGLNLHHLPSRRGIMTILWYEQSMNLFMYLQASQRAWRLGAHEEVRIHLPFYMGTAAHTKMRKLGGQSGAAAAFAGEPAKGELIKRMGADQTTLARLSASLEEESIFGEASLDAPAAKTTVEDLAQIEADFVRRNDELVAALKEGRQWLGIKDTLPERVATRMALRYPDIWQVVPRVTVLPDESLFLPGMQAEMEHPSEETVVSDPAAVAFPVTEGSVRDQTQEAWVSTEMEACSVPEVVALVAFVPQDSLPSVPALAEPQPAMLVFGDEDDIRQARRRRGTRPRRTLPRLKNPLIVKDIPAEQPTASSLPETEMMVASWWEMSFSDEENVDVA